MFQAFQSAARRCASSSSSQAAAAATSRSSASVAAAGLLLAAFVNEGHRAEEGNDGSARCEAAGDVGGEGSSSSSCGGDPSARLDGNNSGGSRSRLPFSRVNNNLVATSAITTSPSAEISHRHTGLLPVDRHPDLRLQRAVTSKRMAAERSSRTFFMAYEVEFDDPLGSGAYGDVYLCRERTSGEACALKKIPKEFTDDDEFQREMNALLHIRAHGGHPNICMLRENFDEADDYLLVLDLVDGGEMFEHLIKHGAYSEADASRLLRQVASALDFIHGIGIVHAGAL